MPRKSKTGGSPTPSDSGNKKTSDSPSPGVPAPPIEPSPTSTAPAPAGSSPAAAPAGPGQSQPAQAPEVHTRVLDLGNGLAIYRATMLKLRERRKNARIMRPYQMEVLTNTLKRYKRLESLPLCCFETTKGGNRELCIIDGHHRVRASIAAGLATAYALVIEEELTREQIVSRQLAHN